MDAIQTPLRVAAFLTVTFLCLMLHYNNIRKLEPPNQNSIFRLLNIQALEQRYERLRLMLPRDKPVGYIGVTPRRINERRAYNTALYALAPTRLIPMGNKVDEPGLALSTVAPSLLFRTDGPPFDRARYVVVDYLDGATLRDFAFVHSDYTFEPIDGLPDTLVLFRRIELR